MAYLGQHIRKPSRGRIKQVKTTLKKLTKGSESISEFMQNIKARFDELALLGVPLDAKDLTEKVQIGRAHV